MDLEAETGGAPECGNRARRANWWKIEGPNANRNADNGDRTYELSGRNKDLGIGVKAIYATFWLRLLLRAAHEQFDWVRLCLTGME